MSDNTGIEWADATWNPITGCSPASEGCRNCYARRMARRLAGRFGYPKGDGFKIAFHKNKILEPTTWRKPRKIFVCSMGDLFHAMVLDDWRDKVFKTMSQCQRHTFMLLTKRATLMRDYWSWMRDRAAYLGIPQPMLNVWQGVTVENQDQVGRAGWLSNTPDVAVRFISCEPLLGFVDLKPVLDLHRIHWVIAGAETGPNARPMQREWIRDLRDQVIGRGIPFFFKRWSWGEETIDGEMWREMPKAGACSLPVG